jgi:proteic killer suppression protein
LIEEFACDGTSDIYNAVDSAAARTVLPQRLWRVAQRKLDLLEAAINLRDLASPPGNRLEPLRGDLRGRFSIRINRQFRVIFTWADGSARSVYIHDYH